MSEPVDTLISPNKSVEIVLIPMVGTGIDKKSDAALVILCEDVVP